MPGYLSRLPNVGAAQMLAPEVNHYRELFTQRPAQSEPHWLQQMRTQGLASFSQAGFPAPNAEEWRYTRLTGWRARAFSPAVPPEQAVIPPELLAVDFAQSLVFIDGYPLNREGLAQLPAGVTVMDWQTALHQQPAQLEQWLAASNHPDTPFSGLNSAFFASGGVIHLAAGVKLTQPLHVLWLTSAACELKMQHPRLLCVAEADSSLTLVEEYASLAQTTHFTNSVSTFHLEARTRVEHYHVQNSSEKSLYLAELRVTQAAASHYLSVMLALGGALARQDIQVKLQGTAASCALHGLYLAKGKQHPDFHTKIDHIATDCLSRENYRGILDDYARAVFSGKIIVHKDAQRTDSNQQNNTLLLSDNAEIDTKPQLEIFADDVKCAHGATVGQLDPEPLFYLRTRGIALAEARQLLMRAFAQRVLQGLPDERVVTWLGSKLARKLEAFNLP